MNVTFSCKVLSRRAQLVSVFSRMFKFSRIVIYRAKSWRSGLEWGDLLILFNRNNCLLRVQFFSNLGKHCAVSNLCSTWRANSCWERFSFLKDNEKYDFWHNAHDQYTSLLARPLLIAFQVLRTLFGLFAFKRMYLLIALQVVRTLFGFQLRECMGSSPPPPTIDRFIGRYINQQYRGQLLVSDRLLYNMCFRVFLKARSMEVSFTGDRKCYFFETTHLVRLKVFEWIKFLRRHLHQIQETELVEIL